MHKTRCFKTWRMVTEEEQRYEIKTEGKRENWAQIIGSLRLQSSSTKANGENRRDKRSLKTGWEMRGMKLTHFFALWRRTDPDDKTKIQIGTFKTRDKGGHHQDFLVDNQKVENKGIWACAWAQIRRQLSQVNATSPCMDYEGSCQELKLRTCPWPVTFFLDNKKKLGNHPQRLSMNDVEIVKSTVRERRNYGTCYSIGLN